MSPRHTFSLSSPAQVCATYDHGAGVLLGTDTFAIYSLASLPISCQTVLESDGVLRSELDASASHACELLPVHVDQTPLDHLSSLPLPDARPGHMSILYRPPWFLVRAAMFPNHCVIGQNSATETLLVVLQRPWCVLEICCCDLQTVERTLAFAKLAASIESRTYDAAVRLLSHEQAMRNLEPGLPVSHIYSYSPRKIAALRDIYTATTFNGIRSNNPFWLLLICTCAVYQNVAFSQIIQNIRDEEYTGRNTNYKVFLSRLYLELVRKLGETAS